MEVAWLPDLTATEYSWTLDQHFSSAEGRAEETEKMWTALAREFWAEDAAARRLLAQDAESLELALRLARSGFAPREKVSSLIEGFSGENTDNEKLFTSLEPLSVCIGLDAYEVAQLADDEHNIPNIPISVRNGTDAVLQSFGVCISQRHE